MTGDLQRTIAFAFRRKGAETMPGGDLRLLLAYDLRWFAPEDAKRVVQRALETGLLREDEGSLRPAFDTAGTPIPLNFRPTLSVLEEEVTGISPAAAPAAAPAPAPAAPVAPAAATPQPAPVAPDAAATAIARAAEDERRKRGLLLAPEVAHLVVRRRAGEDVAAEAAALEARMLRG